MDEAPPLASGDDSPAAAEPATTPAPPGPPPGPVLQFKPTTAILAFLFILGLLMIFEASVRYGVAGQLIGPVFWPLFGFAGNYPFLTMAIAGILEMLATALAYNWATDWIKAAKVQKWSAALRKVQMAAYRSGKKDRIAALAPHQTKLTQLSTEVSLSQMKGMAVTWFLVIAIYSWVYLFIFGCAASGAAAYSGCTTGPAVVQSITIAGSVVNLDGPVLGFQHALWFLIFTLYTVPFSLLFRRVLKHLALRRYADRPAPPAEAGASGAGA